MCVVDPQILTCSVHCCCMHRFQVPLETLDGLDATAVLKEAYAGTQFGFDDDVDAGS
jgi:hypothetical protein